MNYNHLLTYSVSRPKVIYRTVLFLFVAALIMLPNITIDTDPENMLSASNESRLFHNQVKSDFAMSDTIVVGLVSDSSVFKPKTLSAIESLSTYVLSLEEVVAKDLLSLSTVDNITQTGAGEIRFEYLMKQAPTDLLGSERVFEHVQRLPLLNNTLVSENGQAAAIYIPIKSKDESFAVAEKVRAKVAGFDIDATFYVTGLPVAEDQFGYEMFVQMGVAAPLAGLAIFILLWYFFRNLTIIIAPMILAMATVIIIMGSLIGLGFTVHIMSSMIAIFLMPIAVVDSVHILSEFADRFKKGRSVEEVIREVMQHLYTPMLYTSITSAVGFLSLMLTPIPPVKVFGAFIAAGILLAFLLTITFIPAYLSRLTEKEIEKIQKAFSRLHEETGLSKFLVKLGGASVKYNKLLLVAFIGLLATAFVGISKIEVNDNPVNWFKADHEIRVADKALNKHFAGTYDAWLVLQANTNGAKIPEAIQQWVEKASSQNVDLSLLSKLFEKDSAIKLLSNEALILVDELSFNVEPSLEPLYQELYQLIESEMAKTQLFMQPEVLAWMDKLQNKLTKTSLVGKANGLSDIVKTVNRELRSGQPADFVLPETSNGIAQTLLQYQSSHRPDDLWHFVTKDYQQSLIWLQLTSGDNQHMSDVVAWVDDYVKQNPLPEGVSLNWAGKSYLNVVWQDAMVNGMLDSLLSSFVIVFLMMVFLFRSLALGVLAMLPLTFTISFIYGLIGWVGKSYDMPIAVLSALTLGLSIDFAIHFIQRLRELEVAEGSLSKALTHMFQEPARAISRNAIVIAVGFTPLLLSPLVPYITVGTFLASIMAVSALVTLVLLPAIRSAFGNNN